MRGGLLGEEYGWSSIKLNKVVIIVVVVVGDCCLILFLPLPRALLFLYVNVLWLNL